MSEVVPFRINSDGQELPAEYPTMGHAIEACLLDDRTPIKNPREQLLTAAAEIKRLAALNGSLEERYKGISIQVGTEMHQIGLKIGLVWGYGIGLAVCAIARLLEWWLP